MAVRSKQKGLANTLGAFEELFRGIWMRLVPIVGVTATAALLREAFSASSAQYRFLQHVRVKDSGVGLEELNGEMETDAESAAELEEALSGYLEIFIQLIRKNLGEGVAQKLIDYLESKNRGKTVAAVFHRTGLNF